MNNRKCSVARLLNMCSNISFWGNLRIASPNSLWSKTSRLIVNYDDSKSSITIPCRRIQKSGPSKSTTSRLGMLLEFQFV